MIISVRGYWSLAPVKAMEKLLSGNEK